MKTKTLSPALLRRMDIYWSAANHLSVGQLFAGESAPAQTAPCTRDWRSRNLKTNKEH